VFNYKLFIVNYTWAADHDILMVYLVFTIVNLQHRPQVAEEIIVNSVRLNFVKLSSHVYVFLILQDLISRNELLDILNFHLGCCTDDCPELVAIVRIVLTQVEAVILNPVSVRV